jgi:hypothetical protein
MSDNIRRSIYLTPEMSEQIETYAAAKHITFNQAVRQLVEKSLTLTSYADGESMIRQYIHEEVNNSLGPYMSQINGILERRIIPICAKASRTSAITFAVVIGMLTENYTDGRTHEQILSTAMKYAGQYLKDKPRAESEQLASARELLNIAYGLGNDGDGV